MSTVCYRREYVKCGKCGCKKCPHGPYWYAYWKEGGRTKSRYIGKELPWQNNRSTAEPHGKDTSGIQRHHWDKIFSTRTATIKLAADILGVPLCAGRDQVEKAYKLLVWEHHPDRGGDAHLMKQINAAKDWWDQYGNLWA